MVQNLKPDTTYRFTVAAVTSAGIGPYSTAGTYSTSPIGKLGID